VQTTSAQLAQYDNRSLVVAECGATLQGTLLEVIGFRKVTKLDKIFNVLRGIHKHRVLRITHHNKHCSQTNKKMQMLVGGTKINKLQIIKSYFLKSTGSLLIARLLRSLNTFSIQCSILLQFSLDLTQQTEH